MLDFIPLLLIIIPLSGIIVSIFTKKYRISSILVSSINLLICIYLFSFFLSNNSIEVKYPFSVFPEGIYLKIDLISFVFVLTVSAIWFLVSVFSSSYIRNKIPRYNTFLMLTQSLLLGVFIAGDFLSLFFFFELLTLTSYVLVVHKGDKDSKKAGYFYLFLGVMGGLFLLAGIILLYNLTGSVLIKPSFQDLNQDSGIKYLIALLMITGFGVKAGMFPVHIWLPRAHPVAPGPASALLSGLIIKAGAYGIFKVVIVLFRSSGSVILKNIGFIVIILGSLTMFIGMLKALFQWNIKKILAYSSMSQMGYILIGIGVTAILGKDGGIGIGGTLYHIINHSIFKTAAFLIVSTVYYLTHEVNLKRLQGTGRGSPFLIFTFIITLMGISGFPLFNGYGSKLLLHHGLLEAVHSTGSIYLKIVEKIFIITSAGTLCYFLKIFYFLFLKSSEDKRKKFGLIPESMKYVISVFSVLILFFGFFPDLIVKKYLVNILSELQFQTHILEHIKFFTWNNISGTFIYLISGLIFFSIVIYKNCFDYKLPELITVEKIGYSCFKFIVFKSNITEKRDKLYKKVRNIPELFKLLMIKIDRNPDNDSNVLTIKNIEFSKMYVAVILLVVIFLFIE